MTKKLQHNHTLYTHFTPLLGVIPIVLLAPEDVLLITGGPGKRRRFLDLQIAQSDPVYVYQATRYYRAMQHRNLLLRHKTETTLDNWESLMASSASYIHRKRKELVEQLKHYLGSPLSQDSLELEYLPSYTEDYRRLRPKEFLTGTTLTGPHRDDLVICINQQKAALFASQGEVRSAIAALKLAQWHHLKDYHGIAPIFCMDDFGVHLDSIRKEALLQVFLSLGQTFLTSPRFESASAATTWQLSDGKMGLKSSI